MTITIVTTNDARKWQTACKQFYLIKMDSKRITDVLPMEKSDLGARIEEFNLTATAIGHCLNRKNSGHDEKRNVLIIDLDNIIDKIDMAFVLPNNYLIYFNIYINVNTSGLCMSVLVIYFSKSWKIKNEWEITISNDNIRKTLLEMSIQVSFDKENNKYVLAKQILSGVKAII